MLTVEQNGLDVSLIAPERGTKYSPNLSLAYRKARQHPFVGLAGVPRHDRDIVDRHA